MEKKKRDTSDVRPQTLVIFPRQTALPLILPDYTFFVLLDCNQLSTNFNYIICCLMLLYLGLKVIHKTDEINKVNVLKLPFKKKTYSIHYLLSSSTFIVSGISLIIYNVFFCTQHKKSDERLRNFDFYLTGVSRFASSENISLSSSA